MAHGNSNPLETCRPPCWCTWFLFILSASWFWHSYCTFRHDRPYIWWDPTATASFPLPIWRASPCHCCQWDSLTRRLCAMIFLDPRSLPLKTWSCRPCTWWFLTEIWDLPFQSSLIFFLWPWSRTPWGYPLPEWALSWPGLRCWRWRSSWACWAWFLCFFWIIWGSSDCWCERGWKCEILCLGNDLRPECSPVLLYYWGGLVSGPVWVWVSPITSIYYRRWIT